MFAGSVMCNCRREAVRATFVRARIVGRAAIMINPGLFVAQLQLFWPVALGGCANGKSKVESYDVGGSPALKQLQGNRWGETKDRYAIDSYKDVIYKILLSSVGLFLAWGIVRDEKTVRQ